MSNDQTCDWTGKSGTKYTYYVKKLPVDFDPNQSGNYIFTKVSSENKWIPIYIGQGDLAGRIDDSHHKAQCIKSKGATHVHVHLNGRKDDREREESDLLANYTNAYSPNGCNEKIGG